MAPPPATDPIDGVAAASQDSVGEGGAIGDNPNDDTADGIANDSERQPLLGSRAAASADVAALVSANHSGEGADVVAAAVAQLRVAAERQRRARNVAVGAAVFAVLCLVLWAALFSGAAEKAPSPLPRIDEAAVLKSLRARPRRVAVVGGGPTGASLAYFLRRALDNITASAAGADAQDLVHIELFEAGDQLGGRARLLRIPVPAAGKDYVEVEAGASIFVRRNAHLVAAAREFGLEMGDLEEGTGSGDGGGAGGKKLDMTVGIWDGAQFVYRTRSGGVAGALWSAAEAAFRWGPVTALRARAASRDGADRFARAYGLADALQFGYSTPEGLLHALGLDSWATSGAVTGLTSGAGLGKRFVHEFVDAVTRVNYGVGVGVASHLAAAICLVAAFDETLAVRGGNARIFEEMAERSGAAVRTNCAVKKIEKKKPLLAGGGARFVISDSWGRKNEFDDVVLAVPSNKALDYIQFVNIEPPRRVEFVDLHVTFVTGVPDPTYFGQPPTAGVPRVVLTTAAGAADPADSGAHAPTPPPFNSLGRRLAFGDAAGTSVTKIFSAAPVNDTLLAALFASVVRVDRLRWDAYPLLRPLSTDGGAGWPPIVLDDDGVLLPNAMEAAVSAMETATVAGRNGAQLLLRRWAEQGLAAAAAAGTVVDDEGQE